eukprot:TRINITY_DN4694_c0_g1_i2.p1 TRINITY_DN4694_c0_g1~~TRINITY_DN4694_c0_g1_i2.p1  ORF type:complete len:111 (-),score=32.14 TRINITY_DN4694_c0_g1_i2:102-434(-)
MTGTTHTAHAKQRHTIDVNAQENQSPVESVDRTRALMAVFVVALLSLAYVLLQMPTLDEESKARLRMPKSVEDVRDLSNILQKYCDNHYSAVIVGFCLTYILYPWQSIES